MFKKIKQHFKNKRFQMALESHNRMISALADLIKWQEFKQSWLKRTSIGEAITNYIEYQAEIIDYDNQIRRAKERFFQARQEVIKNG